MKKLAILGASGHGKVVADTAECCGWDMTVFFDDAYPKLQKNGAWSVVGDSADLLSNFHKFTSVVVAIGENGIRHAKLIELIAVGANIATLIHPSATVSRYANLGEGTVVFAGAIINAYAQVGLGTILNTGCSIDHDCLLGDAVHISPGARLAGNVEVGDQSWIGIGATVRQSICLGKYVTVGAGAVVVNNISDRVTVAGVPAKILQ